MLFSTSSRLINLIKQGCSAHNSLPHVKLLYPSFEVCRQDLHTSAISQMSSKPPPKMPPMPTLHEEYIIKNKYKFPIQKLDEERRPAYICYTKSNVRGGIKKFWFPMALIRGMKIDDAIHQLQFKPSSKCHAVAEVLEEARELALKEHNVEFGSNLWIAETRVTRGWHIDGIRRHARKRMGKVQYWYTHLHVTLEEGEAPRNFEISHTRKPTPEQMLSQWIDELRQRKPDGINETSKYTNVLGREVPF